MTCIFKSVRRPRQKRTPNDPLKIVHDESYIVISDKNMIFDEKLTLDIGRHALTLPIDLASTGFVGDHFLTGDGLKLNSLFLFKLLSKS